jgi:hypothetical protein
MNNEKFWLTLWSIVTTGVLGLAAIIIAYNYEQDKMMVEAGLQECHYTHSGFTRTVWQRDCK